METKDNEKTVTTVNYFYGNITNYNEYKVPVTYNGPVNNYGGSNIDDGDCQELAQSGKNATKDMMIRAVRITQKNGYWKSQKSWSVIFLVYCIWGYKGRVSDFLTEVTEWPKELTCQIVCNRYAVEKLKNSYHFSKEISEWRGNGIPEQYCILGEQLDQELTLMSMKNK